MTPTVFAGPPAPITYRVWHRTSYAYERPMTDGYTVAHLSPRDTPWQRVRDVDVTISPTPDEIDDSTDVFGNNVLQVGVHHAHSELVVDATSTVEVTHPAAPDTSLPWDDVRTRAEAPIGDDALEIGPFLGSSPFIDLDAHRGALEDLTRAAFLPCRPIVDAVAALCHEIFTTFEFDASFSELSTPLGAVLDERRGVCQDFAHVSVASLRALGLPARYVSGYIETDPPPGESRTFGADASHAWCSVWVPGVGWLDVDPTNDHVPAHRHVTIAWGRDYGDVTPVRGVVIGPSSTQHLEVAVDVSRL